jgi:NIMA (never in mitosis gene a)-related kinase 2
VLEGTLGKLFVNVNEIGEIPSPPSPLSVSRLPHSTNLDEEIIWRILSQIVLALKDCHRRVENGERKPILHRDLKPANIMLDQDENLKIGDFGLAKELSGESKLARTNVGTPFYMSPELVNGNKYDERSDIWWAPLLSSRLTVLLICARAVGCLLYELASLRPPFDAPNQLTLAMKISAGRFHRIPNKYSDDLQNAIRSPPLDPSILTPHRAMLQVDSSKRPRIEDLINLPALQSALRQSNLVVREAQLNQVSPSLPPSLPDPPSSSPTLPSGGSSSPEKFLSTIARRSCGS